MKNNIEQGGIVPLKIWIKCKYQRTPTQMNAEFGVIVWFPVVRRSEAQFGAEEVVFSHNLHTQSHNHNLFVSWIDKFVSESWVHTLFWVADELWWHLRLLVLIGTSWKMFVAEKCEVATPVQFSVTLLASFVILLSKVSFLKSNLTCVSSLRNIILLKKSLDTVA